MNGMALALGAALLPLGMQRYAIALAAFLAPALLLRVMRAAPSGWRGFLAVYATYIVGLAVVHTPAYTGMDAIGVAVLTPIVALLHTFAYVLDRFCRARAPRSIAWLAFPCWFVALEFAAMRVGPFGDNDIMANSLVRMPGLMQLASVTGVSALGFLVYALAPLANDAWESRERRAPLVAFLGVLGVVWLGGELRLALNPPAPAGTPVAAVALDAATYAAVLDGLKMRDVAQGGPELRATLHDRTTPAHAQLLDKTERAAAAGAKLVAWPETTVVLEEDLDALLDRARGIARAHGVFLVVTPWVVKRTTEFPYGRNLAIGIGPDGAERWRYDKQHPVMGMELSIAPGAAAAPIADTALGRIGSAICLDNDYPALVRESARSGLDLWVAPSDDWPEVARAHSSALGYRAIEEGVSLIKPTHNGLSVIVDPYGRVLAELDTIAAAQPFAFATVPRQGVATLYARFGDWFAWLAVGALALVLLRATAFRRAFAPLNPVGAVAP